MHKIKRILHSTVLYATSIVLVGAMPMVTFAEDAPETYTYDSANGRWNSSSYIYDKASNSYVPAPSPAPTTTPEATPPATTSDAPADAAANSAAIDGLGGPGGTAVVNENVDANSTTEITKDASIKNGINSNAGTGNAGVRSNVRAGDALTGDANANATIINSVHTTVDGSTEGVAKFTTNIYGDVLGDITIGPNIANAQIDRNLNLNSRTDINNKDAITNDVNIRAASGDAEVAQNTQAGNAQSGDANAVANVLNLINTIIGANKSFIGTINIYGNLNGDILISPEFIPQLLASNAVTTSEITMPLSMNMNNDNNIVNNVNLNATTGDANVRDNTGAGSATTGTASTKLTVLNLTGHKVNAANSLLVFVNVLGQWVGMIVDAPGATAAALGNGVISDTVNISDTQNLNNSASIVNNLNLGASSGDASVAQNTLAGNATSGDATASANIANISTSEFQLTDWFGVLFINVFGSWIGSFGVDTAAGTIVPLTGDAIPNSTGPNLRLGFNPRPSAQSQLSALASSTDEGSARSAAAALLASMPNGPTPGAPQLRPLASPREDPFSAIMMTAGFGIAAISGIFYAVRRRAEIREAAEQSISGLTIPHAH